VKIKIVISFYQFLYSWTGNFWTQHYLYPNTHNKDKEGSKR